MEDSFEIKGSDSEPEKPYFGMPKQELEKAVKKHKAKRKFDPKRNH